jgi:hypothetical protein
LKEEAKNFYLFGTASNGQKFFGSFFQKRTAVVALAFGWR